MSVKKPRTARAVSANQGVQKEYAARLRKVLALVIREALSEIEADFARAGMAQDAANTPPDTSIQDYINGRFTENMARWLVHATQRAKDVSRWYCREVYRTTTNAQKKALIAAGMSKKAIDMRWGIPVLKRQYISPTAAKNLESDIRANTELITKMAAQDLERLQSLMNESAKRNVNFSDIESVLKASEGFDEARAKRVALDQTNKLNQQIQRNNAKDLGITKFIWVHIPGKYTSRHTHIAMNGKTFEADKGLWDEDVEDFVLPGELPYCRCQSRMILPEELFE